MTSNLEESIKIWADEYGIVLTDIQIESLAESVEMLREMDMYSAGWTQGHTEKSECQIKNETLKKQIQSMDNTFDEKIETIHREYGYKIDRLMSRIRELELARGN